MEQTKIKDKKELWRKYFKLALKGDSIAEQIDEAAEQFPQDEALREIFINQAEGTAKKVEALVKKLIDVDTKMAVVLFEIAGKTNINLN